MRQEIVLVVEDNQDMQVFLQEGVLEPAGYRTLMAADGQEGLERALADEPDLILLDLNLPRLSGLNVLTESYQQERRIPAIVISAYGSEEAILAAFRLGAKDFCKSLSVPNRLELRSRMH
jgi:two-component system, OmpR family, alkaline phosphatase synthesis response regulator PhoP